MKKLFGIILLIFSLIHLGFLEKKYAIQEGTKTIVIDAGHGGKDPGAMYGGKKEKDVALAIALKVGKLIEDSIPNVKILYTRKSDIFVELWERTNIANKAKADLFLSIHCNAADNTSAEGTETFVMGLHKNESNLEVAKRENASILLEENYQKNENYGGFDPNSPVGHIIFSMFQNAFLNRSLDLASKVENEFRTNTQLKSRGVKQAGFLVLWKSSMPSVLIEIGFLSNQKDREYMTSGDGQENISHSIFKAVNKFTNTKTN